jgi:hypothetical protein
MDPSIQQLTAQLASEQKANGVLALRLQTLKASQLPASRLSELCAHETENAAWRRLFQSMALRGRSPLEAVKDEAYIQEHSGVPPAESFWSFLQTLGLGIAPPLPAPLAPLAPRLPAPLLDCFLVCGPAFDALLGLWRTPAYGRALGEEAPPLAVSLASFISGASHPQAVLQPEVLYTYPPDAPLPAEPSALSAFCYPEGAAVSAVPLPSLVAQLRAQGSSFALDRGGSLDCLFERAPGQGKGPRTHTFLLTGSQSDAPFSSSQLAQASFGSSAATEARTRYCMCLAVTATVTLNMLHGLATGHPPKGDSSPHFALSVPTVFCAVSRYPFFPAHAYLLRAVAAQWRRVQEARMRQFGLGRVATADPASSAAATGSPAAAPASAEAEGEEGASAAEAVEVAAAEEEAPLPPPSTASWRSMFSKAESPPPKQPASFWGHFHLGSPSAAASRRSSTAAPLPAAAAAALQRQSLADTALAPSPAQPPTAAPAFLSEDEQALLAARLAVHCFPEPLVATVAAYASLPVPQHGGTLQWRQGLAPLHFCRPPRSSSSSSSSGGALEESGGSAPQPAYDTAVGLRDPETRAALLAHALPVLASLLPPDSLLLLLGAALTEKRLVFVGGALSLEALTAAVAAFPLLLSPLAWEGLHLPVLPRALLEVLQAPLPYIVGLRSLPPRFEQDEETIVVLLDRETLRIPASHIPSGLFGGGSGDRTAGGGGAAAAQEAQQPSSLSASPLPPPLTFSPFSSQRLPRSFTGWSLWLLSCARG